LKTILEDGRIKLEASDWRYSASILGLIRYFDYNGLDYEENEDYIIYNQNDITSHYYVEYIDYRYHDELAYNILLNKLNKEELTEEDIKDINKYIKESPTALKNVIFPLDEDNKDELIQVLKENKEEIILGIFRYRKKNGYIKFCNKGSLMKEDSFMCRVNNFNVDEGRKTHLLTWQREKSSYINEDVQEFDFIPFGFSKDHLSIFINNNFSTQSLCVANSCFKNEINSKIALYQYLTTETANENLFNNIEVIIKDIDSNYKTLYIDRKIINILTLMKELDNKYELEKFKFKIRDDFYVDLNYILTLIFERKNLDSLINLLIKNKEFKNYYCLNLIIKVNTIIYGKEHQMTEKYKRVYACAKAISDKLDENKLNSYRQKLTSSIVSDNKENVYNILIQLSNYSNVDIGFIFDILDDYDENKNQIYAFIAALRKTKKDEGNNNE